VTTNEPPQKIPETNTESLNKPFVPLQAFDDDNDPFKDALVEAGIVIPKTEPVVHE